MLLSRAYAQVGDDKGAALELDAARAAFEALGVKDALAAREPLLGLGAARDVTKTFMFTDIADSTRLLELLGDHKWHRQLRHQYELTHRLVADHGGRVVKSTGDGVFAVFDSTTRALDCGLALQRSAASELVVDLRIGIHSSVATEFAGDFEGRGVHLAARLVARAEPGQVLATHDTVPTSSRYVVSSRWVETLRGFSEPVEIVAVDTAQTGTSVESAT